MKTSARLTAIMPMQLGIVCAVIYGAIGLLVGIGFFVFSLVMSASPAGFANVPLGAASGPFAGILSVIVFPIFYGIGGLISGIVIGFVYNAAARWTGGIRYTVVVESS